MKNGIENLFERLRGEFDMGEPQPGHEKRFLEKLHQPNHNNHTSWRRFFSIAASVAILVSISAVVFYKMQPPVTQLTPEMQQAQVYFTALLEEEVKKVTHNPTPDTQPLINDALEQLQKLETSYQLLQQDLQKNGNSEQILYAMIVNFQTRIELVKEVLTQIQSIKQLKTNTYETKSI